LLQRPVKVASQAAFVLTESLETCLAHSVRSRVDLHFIPVVVLLVDHFSLIDGGDVHGGSFHGPGALQTPAVDGHFEDEVVFHRIARLELCDVSLMKFGPAIFGLTFQDYEFVSGESVLDSVLGRPRAAFVGLGAVGSGTVPARCFDLCLRTHTSFSGYTLASRFMGFWKDCW
jgi:hypothetical protein